ncbi:hypothetical protein [Helicobacter burdigaliensis]|uniref:hypothetical protein n=1 Tax=Helicobacter burdigaliensis TaxID=2315334 RepID=UPI000EF6477C|nr:hypothetical protein [Helicobacter burdigaliensis]
MLKKSKTIYLYPSGEDSQAIFVILSELKKYKIFEINLEFIDDALKETSLINTQDKIKENGELWIIHQDKSIYDKLCLNAKKLNINFFNGIQKCENLMQECFRGLKREEIYSNKQNESFYILSYVAYFVLHFFISLDKGSVFLKEFLEFAKNISDFFKNSLKIPQNAIGIQRTSFGANKHLGDIGENLEKMGAKVVYVYGEEALYLKEREIYKVRCVFFPIQSSYFGCFLNIFKFYVTCFMPHTTPNSETKYIYVPHAFIDPIASLAQRSRPLDSFYFKRKMGINGYRIISSLSNYKIYKEGFKGSGYEEELVCGGYPSLELSIKEYQNYLISQKVSGGGVIF